jgi:ABC-type uncharacterized transport system auxiliary subunit
VTATAAAFVVALASLAGCGGAVPDTRYYQLAPPQAADAKPDGSGDVVAVELLESVPPYDDPRMIYRLDAYRLDYYNYDRWSAAPGTLAASYLVASLVHSGRFRAVITGTTTDASVILGGRVLAIEELDRTGAHPVGHVAVELEARDAETSRPVWRARFDELEPMTARDPEALARAVTTAMQHIADQAVRSLGALRSDTPARRENLVHPG